MAPLAHVALLCLGLACMTTLVTSQPQNCSTPEWPSGFEGENPVAANRGKVVLVALMKGYCHYCVRQAAGLEYLQRALMEQGFPDIEMALVNGGEQISRIQIHNLQNAANFSVLQDTEDHVLYQQVFNADKDDFVIYDRCGQRVFLLPHPYSYLRRPFTSTVLRTVHRGSHQCHCSLDPPRQRTRERGSRRRERTRSRPERALDDDTQMMDTAGNRVESQWRGDSSESIDRHFMELLDDMVSRYKLESLDSELAQSANGEFDIGSKDIEVTTEREESARKHGRFRRHMDGRPSFGSRRDDDAMQQSGEDSDSAVGSAGRRGGSARLGFGARRYDVVHRHMGDNADSDGAPRIRDEHHGRRRLEVHDDLLERLPIQVRRRITSTRARRIGPLSRDLLGTFPTRHRSHPARRTQGRRRPTFGGRRPSGSTIRYRIRGQTI